MNNRLLEEVEYRVVETGFGVWRSYGYESGQFYHELTSHAQVAGLPLAALFGVGQFATGYAAIGQFGLGKYVLGQGGSANMSGARAGLTRRRLSSSSRCP
jgi:hypothetical protein